MIFATTNMQLVSCSLLLLCVCLGSELLQCSKPAADADGVEHCHKPHTESQHKIKQQTAEHRQQEGQDSSWQDC